MMYDSAKTLSLFLSQQLSCNNKCFVNTDENWQENLLFE